ncbi:hypothetical protein A6F58_19560 [Prescottella equi]|nr:hypothetical protein A6F58_19560 [Prescottella equi]
MSVETLDIEPSGRLRPGIDQNCQWRIQRGGCRESLVDVAAIWFTCIFCFEARDNVAIGILQEAIRFDGARKSFPTIRAGVSGRYE